MAIPVGVILHSFSKLIHPAYGHMHHRVGDWLRALQEDRTGQHRWEMWCSFPQNAGPRPPETLKTHKVLSRHIFTYINVPACHENENLAGARLSRHQREAGHGAFPEEGATVTGCHGPLGWGQSSSLSSFRTTLVERYQDRLLVCVCVASLLSIWMYLSSPSALSTRSPRFPPSWRD